MQTQPAVNPATFAALLDAAVREPGIVSKAYHAFYGYSLGNQILAMSQCLTREIPPGPIATFMGWKDKGRFVKKGAKALQLCMPVTAKRRATETTETPDEPQKDATFTRFVYRSNWFVLSQTDGADVPPITIPTWNAGAALWELHITEIPFDHLDGNCQGYAREFSIAVSPVAEYPHKTRFHELAHVVLGHTTEADTLTDDERTPRTIREVEAEAVAMVCCEALGLPGSVESRGYIQHWNQSGEAIPEKSAQRIFKAADQILKAGAVESDDDAASTGTHVEVEA